MIVVWLMPKSPNYISNGIDVNKKQTLMHGEAIHTKFINEDVATTSRLKINNGIVCHNFRFEDQHA